MNFFGKIFETIFQWNFNKSLEQKFQEKKFGKQNLRTKFGRKKFGYKNLEAKT